MKTILFKASDYIKTPEEVEALVRLGVETELKLEAEIERLNKLLMERGLEVYELRAKLRAYEQTTSESVDDGWCPSCSRYIGHADGCTGKPIKGW